MAELFRYVALGDSTGVGVGAGDDGGYPERLYQRLKRAAVVRPGILNLARSGATSRDVLTEQVERAAAKAPALVTLGVGTNDLWRLVPVEDFALNLDGIARALERSGAEVLVSNIIDVANAPVAGMVQQMFGLTRDVFDTRVREFNAILERLARRPRFTVVDLYGYSQRELPGHPELFCPDGFHPSASGYDRWADLVWPHAERVARQFAERSASPPAT